MDSVFPIIMQCLPLKEDLEETETVFTCLSQLYQSGHPMIGASLPQLIQIIGQALMEDELKKEDQALLAQFVHSISQQNSDVLGAAVKSMPEAQAARIHQCLALTNGS